MKRTILLYPIFFVFDYLITKDIPLPDLPWLIGLLFLLMSIIFCVSYYKTKDIRRSGFVTILTMGWALYYGTASHLLGLFLNIDISLIFSLTFLVIWTLAFLFLGSKYLWQRLFSAQSITTYLNLLTVVLFIFFSYDMIQIETHAFITPLGLSTSDAVKNMKVNARPDIYYIILDGYGRADVLEDMYGYDNSEFLDFLTSKGFYVASQSRSNYMYTALSLPSALNISYLRAFSSGSTPRYSVSKKLISDSWTRSFLERQGYQFVTFSTPFYFTDITDADLFFSLKKDKARIIYLESKFLPSSIAAIPLWADLISPGGETYRDHQERVMYMVEQLGNIPFLPGPKFVFAHIVAPHSPYVFDQNGPITPEKPYLQNTETMEKHIKGYTAELTYLNSLVEKMISAILENSAFPPIILLQADHGPGIFFSGWSKADSCIKEKASILNAYYLPGLMNNPIYKTITPVNSFRIIFNQYFGTHLEILEDKVYYSGGKDFYKFIDVTSETEQSCKLP